MANKLFELFDGNTPNKRDLISSSPKTLAQMTASGSADPLALQTKVDIINQVRPKVQYWDAVSQSFTFENFVYFNSALDYFNISGERMINEWPYDGTYNSQLQFQSQSDGFQNALLSIWPTGVMGARFNTGTYVSVSDVATVSGSVLAGVLAPSGNSMTFEFHISIPPNWPTTEFVVLENLSGAVSNYKLWLTPGALSWSYGNTTNFIDGITTGSWYMAMVFNTSSNSASFYVKAPQPNGWFDQFSPTPVLEPRFLSKSQALTPSGSDAYGASTRFVVGAATSNGDIGLTELRVWKQAQTDEQIFANYNARVYQQDGLQLYWRFQESPIETTVRDYSGHKMHGAIYGATPSNFWTASFGDIGNTPLSPQDGGEYITNVNDVSLHALISSSQTAANTYDKFNSNIITRMVPFMYLYLEDEKNTEVLKNLLYLLARQFDEIKVFIDQLPKFLLPSYTGFDETPNALLADALKFWGWDTKANFLSEDAFRYFFGYDVLQAVEENTYQAAVDDNQKLDRTLNDIKSEFWHRTLQELIYIYKKKGTKEAVASLLRVYGLDDKIVKLKEFGMQPDVRIQTNRIQSDKSAWARDFTAAVAPAVTASSLVSSTFSVGNSGSTAVNMTIRFPIDSTGSQWQTGLAYRVGTMVKDGSYSWKAKVAVPAAPVYRPDMTSSYWSKINTIPYYTSGTIFSLNDGAAHTESLTYLKTSLYSTSGSFYYQGVTLTPPTGVFDGRWYSLAVQRNPGSVTCSISHLDEDVVDSSWSMSGAAASTLVVGNSMKFVVGSGSTVGIGEFRVMNAQVWNLTQSLTERLDHTLNPFSFGAETPERAQMLELNWAFDKDGDESASPQVVFDQSVHHRHGQPFYDRYHRDLFDYNFIAPVDYGWNEEKIRYSDVVRPPPDQNWMDSNIVSLEFNLVDALNEDISLMLASMDNWNNTIGAAANRHRESYPSLDRFRAQYFQRLHNRINFRAFADFLDFFDRSFVELVAKLLPARSKFKGAEFVVESHMLERPKVQYTYRRQSPMLVPEGEILIYGYPPLNIQWMIITGHYP